MHKSTHARDLGLFECFSYLIAVLAAYPYAKISNTFERLKSNQIVSIALNDISIFHFFCGNCVDSSIFDFTPPFFSLVVVILLCNLVRSHSVFVDWRY